MSVIFPHKAFHMKGLWMHLRLPDEERRNTFNEDRDDKILRERERERERERRREKGDREIERTEYVRER